MIRLFRRHRTSCPHTSETYRRCSCPIYGEGKIGDESFPKSSLNLTSWAGATKWVMEREAAGTLKVKPAMTVAEAHAHLLADMEARRISGSARRKAEMLGAKLADFCLTKGISRLDQIGLAEVTEFRATWHSWGAGTQVKYVERLRAFFKFCRARKWISDNPAEFLKPPKPPKSNVVPFGDADLSRIHGLNLKPRTRAFILVLQYTGLRISDAVSLEQAAVSDGRLRIASHKTKTVVWLPLPPFVLSALSALPKSTYYFWTGESKLTAAVGSWRRSLDALFERAGIEGNPHKFRHTFATTLLLNGVSVEDVAKILGNSPKVVEKHYDHWIKARQDRLESEVMKAWGKPRLEAVK